MSDESPRPVDPELQQSLTSLFPSLYTLLRRRSGQVMRGEAPGHTLQATALVHEVFLKLAASGRLYHDEQHLFAVVTTVMRQILVDHARGRATRKRGGGLTQVPLENACVLADQHGAAFLDVQRAFDDFARRDPVRARMFELSFFWGMTHGEIAEQMGLDQAKVKYGIQVARAWLREAVTTAGEEDAQRVPATT